MSCIFWFESIFIALFIGKIGVDDAVLRKQGRFTDEEYNKMKMHSEIGYHMVSEMLSGVEKPDFVRVADVFDALVSKRCYKDAYSYERAYEIIEKDAGTHFDKQLAKVFLSCK